MPSPLVLLADDEPHIPHVLAAKLNAAGVQTLTASDGEEALRLARQHAPSLVITDLQMPFMSGAELAAALDADPRTASIPVILLTGRGYILTEAERTSTNIVDILSKPFSARAIVDRVLALLAQKSDELPPKPAPDTRAA